MNNRLKMVFGKEGTDMLAIFKFFYEGIFGTLRDHTVGPFIVIWAQSSNQPVKLKVPK